MNFKDYPQWLRINEACLLLMESDRKVVDIASAVGYNSFP
ncbi:helix-turn-helix domain-containing protein [Priestia megaterium]|nr:Helix-turn-helix domain [Priestia megaterium]